MISIIIPTWNQNEMTYECVRSIRETTQDCEIIIVDNGSSPPVPKIYAGFIDVTLIRNDENKGFPVAVNQGIRAAKGDVIVLMNNDVIVVPGWADQLRAAIERGYSIVGPMTNYCAGAQRAQVAPYENRYELNQAAVEWYQNYGDHIHEVRWVIGFLMAFTKALYDELGLFDESLWPCSGEEIDFCLRARAAGHKVGIVSGCYVHHEGSVTFKEMNAEHPYNEIIDRNNKHLESKWGKGWDRQRLVDDEEAEGRVRLNLGCGKFPLKGFVNIDQYPEVSPDLVCNVLALPYMRETVDEIYAGHILEHFDWLDGEKALRYWHDLLKPGGKISVAVPDFDVLARKYLANPTPGSLREFNDLYIYSYRQESPHKYAYSGALLREVMENAGFVDLKRLPVDHPYFPHPVDWQVGYEGVKR